MGTYYYLHLIDETRLQHEEVEVRLAGRELSTPLCSLFHTYKDSIFLCIDILFHGGNNIRFLNPL